MKIHDYLMIFVVVWFLLGTLSCAESRGAKGTEKNNSAFDNEVGTSCENEDAVECRGNTVVFCEGGEWQKVTNCEANNMVCEKPFSGPAGCVPLRSIDDEGAETICSSFSEWIRDSTTDQEICRAAVIYVENKTSMKSTKDDCEKFLEMCNDGDFAVSVPTSWLEEIDDACLSTMEAFIENDCIVTNGEAELCARDLAAAFIEQIQSASCDNVMDPAVVTSPNSCKAYESRCSQR